MTMGDLWYQDRGCLIQGNSLAEQKAVDATRSNEAVTIRYIFFLQFARGTPRRAAERTRPG
jgi:hypothetical protein